MKTLILLIVLSIVPTSTSADTIPKEFVVVSVNDGVWRSQNTYIYKTTGPRNGIVFLSNACTAKEYTPQVSNDGNSFVGDNYVLIFTDVGLSLKVISNNKCFVPGMYQRIR
jgi:hypothetical protein